MGIATGILCSIPFGRFLSLDIILLSFVMMATYDTEGHAPQKQQVYDYSVTKHYFMQDIYFIFLCQKPVVYKHIRL